MKASLPFKYIICEKHGKLYVVFDFKDDSGKRKRKWVGTGSMSEQDGYFELASRLQGRSSFSR